MILFELIQNEYKNDQIVYTDKLEVNSIYKIGFHLNRDTIVGYEPNGNIVRLPLSEIDKDILRSKLKKLKKFFWEANLFENSTMIRVDSTWAFIAQRNKEVRDIYLSAVNRNDTAITKQSVNLRVKHCSILQFAPLIFLQDREICIFYLLRLCGPDCGVEELAIYKLDQGRYQKWLTIAGGAF